jgi:hypothetical protein
MCLSTLPSRSAILANDRTQPDARSSIQERALATARRIASRNLMGGFEIELVSKLGPSVIGIANDAESALNVMDEAIRQHPTGHIRIRSGTVLKPLKDRQARRSQVSFRTLPYCRQLDERHRTGRIVKASSLPRCCELQLVLEPAWGEVVRAFAREASLAEGVPVSVANLIADDAA